MFEDYSQDQIDSWIAPEDLCQWQLTIYMNKYSASFGSYKQHFKAAVRHVNPSRISSDRMEYVARQSILARMRGEVPEAGSIGLTPCEGRMEERMRWWK